MMVAVALTAPGTSAQSGFLHRLAKSAKDRGQTTARDVITTSGDDSYRTAEEILRKYSTLIVKPRGFAVAVQTTPEYIYTWHTVDVVRSVSRRPTVRATCNWQTPASLKPKWPLLAFPILGGTARVDGVSITLESDDSRLGLMSGRSYLVIGNVCGAVLSRPHGGDVDVFEISSDGSFAPRRTSPRPLSEFLINIGTLAKLEAYLKDLR